MSRSEPRDVPASVRGRPLNISRETGRPFTGVLQDFAEQVLEARALGREFTSHWAAGGPWRS